MGLVALRAMLFGRDRPGEVLADTAPGLSDDNRDIEYQSKKPRGENVAALRLPVMPISWSLVGGCQEQQCPGGAGQRNPHASAVGQDADREPEEAVERGRGGVGDFGRAVEQ